MTEQQRYTPEQIPLQTILDQNESLLATINSLNQRLLVGTRNQAYTQVRIFYVGLVCFLLEMLYCIVVCILCIALFAPSLSSATASAPPMSNVAKYGIAVFFILVYPFIYMAFFGQIVALVSGMYHTVVGV